MYGQDVGVLNVYTRSTSGTGPLKKVWSKTGNVGDFFERGEVQLYESGNFQVVIEGIVGSGYMGDIALDDLSMTPDCKVVNGEL